MCEFHTFWVNSFQEKNVEHYFLSNPRTDADMKDENDDTTCNMWATNYQITWKNYLHKDTPTYPHMAFLLLLHKQTTSLKWWCGLQKQLACTLYISLVLQHYIQVYECMYVCISVTSTVFKPTGMEFTLNALLHKEQFTENVEWISVLLTSICKRF